MITDNIRYAKTHEWAKKVSDSKVVCGISKYATDQLGDIVFIDLPKAGVIVERERAMFVIESVKTVSDTYAPISGKIAAKNDEIESDPSLVNQDPMVRGWLIEIEMYAPSELDLLMDQAEYDEFCAEAGH